jgi:hypothetical protein
MFAYKRIINENGLMKPLIIQLVPIRYALLWHTWHPENMTPIILFAVSCKKTSLS